MDAEDKEVMRSKREEALERAQKQSEEFFKQREETKRSHEKYAIQEMMKVSIFTKCK